jgi:putative ABC transport system ATP-binding protein
MSKIIKIKNLNKSYGTKNKLITIFEDFNLEIEAGKITAIMGKSGSGKSTLLQIIGLLDKPDFGTITLNGCIVNYGNQDELFSIRSQNIGFVFQNFYLMPELNVFENIELPLLISGIGKKERIRKVNEIMTKLGIINKSTSMPSEISGGQTQRVAIARALINSPKIILADEPTGNLDQVTSNEVMDVFKEIQKNFLTTLVIVTHSLEIANKCDFVVNLNTIK